MIGTEDYAKILEGLANIIRNNGFQGLLTETLVFHGVSLAGSLPNVAIAIHPFQQGWSAEIIGKDFSMTVNFRG